MRRKKPISSDLLVDIDPLTTNQEKFFKEYDEGNLSKEEYKDLLQGLEIEQTITENADELHRKQELQKSIETAIKAVSAIF